MELTEAIELIQNEHLPQTGPANWADLGCGSGLFSFALAHLLPPGSTIHAIDRDPVVLSALPNPKGIAVQPLQLDFESTALPLQQLDGILMANSLHYIPAQKEMILRLAKSLKPDGHFLIVEYDTDKPVQRWVPNPVSYRSLQQLFLRAGFPSAKKIGERSSVYGRANMYAAWVSR